ncbi:MAG: hypothetical protein PWQ82_1291 [Thermosediminibacterales bacterium]|nr:hypothetical protein [Thermosediminibacterales bacterium]MDK2836511.1 hypothetical protein [Thermosediminibacterales bacterium]
MVFTSLSANKGNYIRVGVSPVIYFSIQEKFEIARVTPANLLVPVCASPDCPPDRIDLIKVTKVLDNCQFVSKNIIFWDLFLHPVVPPPAVIIECKTKNIDIAINRIPYDEIEIVLLHYSYDVDIKYIDTAGNQGTTQLFSGPRFYELEFKKLKYQTDFHIQTHFSCRPRVFNDFGTFPEVITFGMKKQGGGKNGFHFYGSSRSSGNRQ